MLGVSCQGKRSILHCMKTLVCQTLCVSWLNKGMIYIDSQCFSDRCPSISLPNSRTSSIVYILVSALNPCARARVISRVFDTIRSRCYHILVIFRGMAVSSSWVHYLPGLWISPFPEAKMHCWREDPNYLGSRTLTPAISVGFWWDIFWQESINWYFGHFRSSSCINIVEYCESLKCAM